MLVLLAVSFGASFLGGMLGMASGVFIVPIMTLFCGIDIHTAIGASLVSVIACSCGSAARFLKSGLTNIRLAAVLEMATTLGALTGVFLIGIVPVEFLYVLFGLVLAVSAKQMLARRGETLQTRPSDNPARSGFMRRLDNSYPDAVHGHVWYEVQRLRLGFALMYCAGLISALLGIGSGVLKIPAMDTALRLPIKVSSATSNFMIGVTAAASAGAYFVRGDIVTGVAAPVALGSVAGAIVGAKVFLAVSSEKIRVFFVVMLALLAVQMFLSAFGVHLPGGSK